MPRVVPEYKLEARDRIISTAVRVFSEKGYHEAKMEDIARELGVSKGALYLYFKSKEELFEENCRTGPRILKETLRSSFSGRSLREGSKVFFEKMLEQSASSLPLNFEALSEASRNPEIKKIIVDNYRSALKIVGDFLEKAKRDGAIKREINSRSFARVLVAIYDGTMTGLAVGMAQSEAKKVWSDAMEAILSYGTVEGKRD